MAAHHPFGTVKRLHQCADDVMDSLSDADWKEAFACHPEIGNLESLRMKFAGNAQWSAGEQAGVADANEEIIRQLADGNRSYHQRFGYIFIVCATGKSALEMLNLLQARLVNAPGAELAIAASEQRKITHLRLDKLIQSTGGQDAKSDHDPRA